MLPLAICLGMAVLVVLCRFRTGWSGCPATNQSWDARRSQLWLWSPRPAPQIDLPALRTAPTIPVLADDSVIDLTGNRMTVTREDATLPKVVTAAWPSVLTPVCGWLSRAARTARRLSWDICCTTLTCRCDRQPPGF